MLRYDAEWLIAQYAGEQPALPGLPYALLEGSGPFAIARAPGEFHLGPTLRLQPRLPYDETVVRLARYQPGQLSVQPCTYSDGIKSNYAMDGTGMDGGGGLREVLRAEFGSRLPPLEDARLSNAIGTAIVVFDGQGLPYLPRRAAGQSVFPGGFHCTASGETVWRDTLHFDELFTAHICRELEEEVGLRTCDLAWIRPVALCREFLRGGKPQFFFAARTLLAAEELTLRRRAAIVRQIAAGRQEILDEAAREVPPELCTLECLANLALAAQSSVQD
jgi:hypothetical protein